MPPHGGSCFSFGQNKTDATKDAEFEMTNVVRLDEQRHARASSAANPAKTSNEISGRPRAHASRTTATQRGPGMPRFFHPLTTDGARESASATSVVSPRAAMIDAQVHDRLPINPDIVRKSRTCQAIADCETTNSQVPWIIRPMDTDMEVANRLVLLREKLGLDQVKFAKSLGVEKSTYNAYERGKRPLTIQTAKLIRRRYGISVDWLLFGDIGQPNHQFLLTIEPPMEPVVQKPGRKKRTAA